MSSVLRPEASVWKRSGRDDPDPEQLAREAVAEIQGALAGLYAILELLKRPPCPGRVRSVHEVRERSESPHKMRSRRDHRR